MLTGAGTPPPDMAERLGRGRIDEFVVDMPALREWVRAAFRGYNTELVRNIQEARS